MLLIFDQLYHSHIQILQSCQPCAAKKSNHNGKKSNLQQKKVIFKYEPLKHARHTKSREKIQNFFFFKCTAVFPFKKT